MAVIPQGNAGIQLPVQDIDQMLQVILVHEAVGVDHRHRERLHFIREPHQIQHLLIRVAGHRDQLREDFIAQFLQLRAERECRIPQVLLKDHADPVQEAFAAGTDILDRTGPVIDHAHDHGLFPVQSAVDLLHAVRMRHDAAVRIVRPSVIQKADFNDIHARVRHTLENADQVIMSEFPVIHISAVPERAVQ